MKKKAEKNPASRGRGNPGPLPSIRSRDHIKHFQTRYTFRHPTPGLAGGRRRRHGRTRIDSSLCFSLTQTETETREVGCRLYKCNIISCRCRCVCVCFCFCLCERETERGVYACASMAPAAPPGKPRCWVSEGVSCLKVFDMISGPDRWQGSGVSPAAGGRIFFSLFFHFFLFFFISHTRPMPKPYV